MFEIIYSSSEVIYLTFALPVTSKTVYITLCENVGCLKQGVTLLTHNMSMSNEMLTYLIKEIQSTILNNT